MVTHFICNRGRLSSCGQNPLVHIPWTSWHAPNNVEVSVHRILQSYVNTMILAATHSAVLLWVLLCHTEDLYLCATFTCTLDQEERSRFPKSRKNYKNLRSANTYLSNVHALDLMGSSPCL